MQQIHAHHGLRGLAELIVFIAHAEIFVQVPEFSWVKDIYPVFYWHGQAVDLFFILSGFILAYIYASHDPLDWKSYFFARVGRIVPVYYAATLVMLGMTFVGIFVLHNQPSPDFTSMLVTNALLVQQWGPEEQRSFVQPAWSVSVEMFLYIFIFPLLLRIPSKWEIRPAISILVILALSGCMFLFYVAAWNMFPFPNLLRGVVGFTVGYFICILARSLALIHIPGTPPVQVKGESTVKSYWRLLDVVLVLSFIVIAFTPPIRVLLPLILPWLVLRSSSNQTIASRVFSGKILVWLGTLSYSIYIWHMPIGSVLGNLYLVIMKIDVFNSVTPFIWRVSYIIVWFILTFLLSIVSLRFFEEPCRKMIRDFGKHLGKRA
jgi:peptidoglycan/LPS O-acetylase OafA/YrhL